MTFCQAVVLSVITLSPATCFCLIPQILIQIYHVLTAKLLREHPCVSQDHKEVQADKNLPSVCQPAHYAIIQNQTSAS